MLIESWYLIYVLFIQSVFALYKGASPPAVGWAAIDSVLLGSLHNYRLLLMRYGMTESVPGTDVKRLTVPAHGIAGLFAGLTRCSMCGIKVFPSADMTVVRS